MTKAVVLDIGGVLIRTMDRSGRDTLESAYGLPPGGADALVFNSSFADASTHGRAQHEQIWRNVAETLSLSQKALEEFIALFWRGDQVDLDLLDYIEKLRATYTTALLSNAWSGARQHFAEEYNIIEGQTVDHILISSELGLAKPDQRIYHILADTVGHTFDQILFVDDFIENIVAAQALGIHTVHFQAGMNLIDQIQSVLDHQ